MSYRRGVSDTTNVVNTPLALHSLLGTAVQYALVRRLSNAPLRLQTMVELSMLAQRSISLHFDRRRLSWTLLSVAWVALSSFLTTALVSHVEISFRLVDILLRYRWSSLLAPERVFIYEDLGGSEINLLNPSVSNLFIDPIIQSQPAPGSSLTPNATDSFV